MTLTEVTKLVGTLLPDGTYIKVEVAPWADGEHRIGEKKRIILEYTTDFDISGFALYINPALFMVETIPNPISGKGTYFYACQLPAVLGSGVEYPATLQSVATNMYLPNGINYQVVVIPDGTNSFSIVIDFFMVHDMTGYIDTGLGNTQIYKKWLNDVYYHPMLTPNSSNLGATDTGSPNIYATPNISPRVYFHMVNPLSAFPQPTISKEEKFVGLRAGYYYKDRTNTNPWFTNTYIEMKRGGNVVNNLSATEVTNCTINANTDNVLNPVTHFLVWIFRGPSVGNLLTDFITGTDAEFHIIKAANLSTTKVCAPMTDPVEVSPQQWQATFNVNLLPYGNDYRMIGIAYSATLTEDYKVNSFITGLLKVDAQPTFNGNGFDVRASLDDYNRQFEGNNLECAIEERMRSKVKLYFPFNKWKNDIYSRLGLVVTNDIRRYLTDVFYSVYDTTVNGFGTTQNIYDYRSSNKVGVNSYTSADGMTMLFDSTSAEFIYEWRNRFEANVPCIATLLNGNPVTPVQSNQYWGGRTLTIKWVLRFTYDNYSIPFTEDIVIFQQIRVKDYGEMAVKHIDEDAEEFDNISNICSDDELCFAGVLQNPELEDRKLIACIRPENGGLLTIEEFENWEGNQLPQLFTDKIPIAAEDYQELYSETAARFCIDGSKLVVNSSYEISAMAKKFVDTGFRITEKNNPSVFEDRITENNDKRIIDNL